MILSAKGIRARRPNPHGPQPIADTRTSGPDYVLTLLRGSVAVLPDSVIPERLADWTKQVAKGRRSTAPATDCDFPFATCSTSCARIGRGIR